MTDTLTDEQLAAGVEALRSAFAAELHDGIAIERARNAAAALQDGEEIVEDVLTSVLRNHYVTRGMIRDAARAWCVATGRAAQPSWIESIARGADPVDVRSEP